MARIGVEFKDIERAALELKGFGKIPTIDGIREILGTGSRSTIAKYLKAWRANQTEVEGALPQELAALVTGLWQKIHNDADQRIEVAETICREQVQNLNQTITKLQQEKINLQNKLHKSEEESEVEKIAKESLDKQAQEYQRELAKLHERLQANSNQLDTEKANNKRLHQVVANTQSNLEHYQEQIQKHQTEQTLKAEKQQSFYLQQIAALKQQLAQQQDLVKPLEYAQKQLKTELDKHNTMYQALLTKHALSDQKLLNLGNEKIVLLERNKNAKDTIHSLQTRINKSEQKRQEIEKNAAIQCDQNKRLQKDISHTQDKVSTLRNENLLLIQEKAQLEGYLNQKTPFKQSAQSTT